GVPWRVDTRPGVLGPARRADVHVPVALAEPDPIHRREVADGIARVAVEDELRLRGRPRREVKEERVGRGGGRVGPPGGAAVGVSVVEARPAGDGGTDGDAE